MADNPPTDPTMMGDLIAAKDLLRRDRLRARDALDPLTRAAFSREAAERFPASLIRPGSVVALYHPIRSEIDTNRLAYRLMEAAVTLALPVITESGLEWRHWQPLETLVPSGFGTKGPGEGAARLVPDLIVMPLAVFDRAGGRIGYGKGFYDRALADLAHDGHYPLSIGFAFAIQAVDHVPAEPHDWRLDAILTEEGLMPVRGGRLSGVEA